jgi:nucleotide-binding universal stress UspA family protein
MMYKHILIPLDNSSSDEAILRHVRPLAKLTGASITLIHVADGFVARNQKGLNLGDSPEMIEDRKYLEKRGAELAAEGFTVDHHLAFGEPADQILSFAEQHDCDLIAMSTHGHRFINDMILGSVASNLRHRTDIPILMVRSQA